MLVFLLCWSDARLQLQSDLDNLKGLMQQLLAKPPADQIVINNEFQGMANKIL